MSFSGSKRMPMECGSFALGTEYWSHREKRIELFDLKTAISETTNLSAVILMD